MFSFAFFGTQYTPSATKCIDGHSGLVRVRGWSGVVNSGKAITFTILDEDDQKAWMRLIEGGSSTAEPLQLDIPCSSIRHRIKVTAKVLKSRSIGPVDGVEHLEVASEGSCTATEELEAVDASSLSHLLSGMSMSAAEANYIANTLQVSIEQVTTSSKAKVIIIHPGVYPMHWIISVKPVGAHYTSCVEHVFVLENKNYNETRHDFDFPISFTSGRKYQVVVQGVDTLDVYANPSTFSTFAENYGFRIIDKGSIEFKAGLTKAELSTLHLKAVEHTGQYSHARCDYLYRNKPQPYFDDIFLNHGGLMEVYIKDNSGDPGSPINGQIKGLFFMATVEPGSTTGQPTRVSAFGGTRLLIPAETLLGMAPNLYFADFYCMRGRFHYVTLVMTRHGSEADTYCSQRLPQLSVHDRSRNPFLFYADYGQLHVSTTDHLHVELLFTEDLDINRYRYELQPNTPLVGKGQSTPGGLPKNPSCSVCNLSPGYNRLLSTGDF